MTTEFHTILFFFNFFPHLFSSLPRSLVFFCSLQTHTTGGLTGTGAMYGIGLGLLIPIFGAIGPIQNALNVELREALDITRSKTKVRCDVVSLPVSTIIYY